VRFPICGRLATLIYTLTFIVRFFFFTRSENESPHA
jgi:hypothetical protein